MCDWPHLRTSEAFQGLAGPVRASLQVASAGLSYNFEALHQQDKRRETPHILGIAL